jgi:hypothetical protein
MKPEYRGNVVDIVLTSLRTRIGRTLSLLEHVPAYGPVLAATDAEATTWCTDGFGIPDPHAVEDIISGRAPAIGFNLPSSHHLLVRMHGLLTAPAVAVGVTNKEEEEGREQEERREVQMTHCEALLTLCDALM